MFKNKYFKVVIVILIFIAALLIRLYYVLDNPDMYANGLGPHGDTALYHQLAYNLYSGNGFSGSDNGAAYGSAREGEIIKYEPAITRGPVYPFFISIVYKFFCNPEDMESIATWHRNWNKVRTAQCVLDAAVCLFVFFIVRIIYPASVWPAIIAEFLYCFNLYNIYFTKSLLSESVTTFLLTSAILLFIISLKKKNLYWWILTGIGFGLTVLGRTEYILSLFVLASFIILVNRHFLSDAVKKALLLIISAFIILSPWTLRNYLVFKELIFVSLSTPGSGLMAGTVKWKNWSNYPDEIFKDAGEREHVRALRTDWIRAFKAGAIDIKKPDRAFMKVFLKRFQENPFQIILTWITTIPNIWYLNNPQLFARKESSGIFFVFYFLFAVYAFFSLRKEERILTCPVFLLFIYINLVLLPFLKLPRHGVALMPGIISLSGIGIWNFISRPLSGLTNHLKAGH